MDEALLTLLDFRDVLSAVATSWDGLVIASAGLAGDDAEVLAAAGSTVAKSLRNARETRLAVEGSGGVLHVMAGQELALVALTEASVGGDAIAEPMAEVLSRLDAAILGSVPS